MSIAVKLAEGTMSINKNAWTRLVGVRRFTCVQGNDKKVALRVRKNNRSGDILVYGINEAADTHCLNGGNTTAGYLLSGNSTNRSEVIATLKQVAADLGVANSAIVAEAIGSLPLTI